MIDMGHGDDFLARDLVGVEITKAQIGLRDMIVEIGEQIVIAGAGGADEKMEVMARGETGAGGGGHHSSPETSRRSARQENHGVNAAVRH